MARTRDLGLDVDGRDIRPLGPRRGETVAIAGGTSSASFALGPIAKQTAPNATMGHKPDYDRNQMR